jgi:predicted DNA-binding transcriptional regulator AlpA
MAFHVGPRQEARPRAGLCGSTGGLAPRVSGDHPTAEAARLLGVSPSMLREWEQQYAFPRPRRMPGERLLFADVEIAALQDALRDGLSVSSAVMRARRQVDERDAP